MFEKKYTNQYTPHVFVTFRAYVTTPNRQEKVYYTLRNKASRSRWANVFFLVQAE